MKNRWVSIFVVAALVAVGTNAHAALITYFDNLPPGQGRIGAATTSTDGYGFLAKRFVTNSSPAGFSLKSVGIHMKEETYDESFDVGVWGETSSKPDKNNIIGTFAQDPLRPISDADFGEAGFIGNISLASNTAYWIVMSATSGAYSWSITDSGTGSGDWISNVSASGADASGSNWNLYSAPPDWTFQMKLQGEPTPAAVPEPSSILLFGGILLGAIGYRRRRYPGSADVS